MHLRARMALLLCAAAAAAFTGFEAWRGLQPRQREEAPPEEIYAPFAAHAATAAFFLRGDGGYVAIYEKGGGREPVTVTDIELSGLRAADRAMIRAGLPVTGQRELLLLLEDLGS